MHKERYMQRQTNKNKTKRRKKEEKMDGVVVEGKRLLVG